MAQSTPKISVLVITHNPRMDLLQWGLDSLEAQTLDKDQWEVVVVDNASPIPLDEAQLRGSRTFNLRLLQEPRLGLSWGRYCGVKNTQAPWMIFLDDDNWFYPDYLERALEITKAAPQLGAFGGIAEGVFEKPIRPWMPPTLAFLGVRNAGTEALFSDNEKRHYAAEPIGAGMVFSRAVGDQYAAYLGNHPDASLLDRKGNSLMSCGDTFLARLSYQLGLACAYQPDLRIKHYMKAGRLSGRYLRQLAFATGKSGVLLASVLDGKVTHCPKPPHVVLKSLLDEFQWHIQAKGRGWFIEWSRMVGWRMAEIGLEMPMEVFLRRRKSLSYRWFLGRLAMKKRWGDGERFLRNQAARVPRIPGKILKAMSGD